MNKSSRIILGIDPGTAVTGYGIILETGKELELLEMGIIRLKEYESLEQKLKEGFTQIGVLIEKFKPLCMAIEEPFLGNKNPQVLLKLGRMQGVAIGAALLHNLSIAEYPPRSIKQAVTGNGSASKEQVSAMLQHILNFKGHPEYLDATDGVAVAVCHSIHKNRPAVVNSTKKKKTGGTWESFIKANPERHILK